MSVAIKPARTHDPKPPRPAAATAARPPAVQATCNEAKTLRPPEIIEFACVALETAGGSAVGEFQTYVRGAVGLRG